MDKLNQLKSETGGSRDTTLDTSSPPSESFMTANESSTKYFSLSEVDSTFNVSPSKDSAISTTADSERTLTDSDIISNLSPIPKKVDNFQIGKQIEAANILSGGVNIFDDNDNSYDGDELVIDDNSAIDDSGKNEAVPFGKGIESETNSVNVADAVASKDTEVVLQIDGKNVDAIAIGNGLYLYRKGVEELAAVQMIDDNQQQPSFKFLKVRENAEGNLEVYEEIEVEVPKEVPTKDGKAVEKKANVPVKDISSVTNITDNDKLIDNITQKNDKTENMTSNLRIEIQPETKTEVNLNGKKVTLNESRKSPLIGTFTPMTYHSTPNKEGIPLTKTMVDQQLHPNRHSDNIKKTIEVHTECSKKDSLNKDKNIEDEKEHADLHFADIETKDIQNKTNCAKSLDSLLQKDKTNDIEQADNFVKEEKENEEECELKINNTEDVSNQGIDNKSVECACVSENYKINKILETKIVNSESDVCINELDSQLKNGDPDSNPKESKLIIEPMQSVHENKVLPQSDTLSKNDNNINVDDKNGKLQTDDCKTTGLTTDNVNELKDKIINKSMTENIVLTTALDIADSKKLPNTDDNSLNINNLCNLEVSHKSEKKNDLKDSNKLIAPFLEKVPSIDTSHTNVLQKTEENVFIYRDEIGDCNEKEDTEKIRNSNAYKVMESNETKDVTSNLKVKSDVLNKMPVKDEIEASADNKSCKMQINKVTEQSPIPDAYMLVTCDKEVEKVTTLYNKEATDSQSKLEHPATVAKTEITKVKIAETKSSNASAVPFGKWTEANRQEFLNKIKVPKVPCSNSNTKQLKQPNDLNRRDILKKIDTQRQVQLTSAKNHDLSAANKPNAKSETAKVFINKPIPSQKPVQEVNKYVASLPETATCKNKEVVSKKTLEEQNVNKDKNESLNILNKQKFLVQRKEINNQDLIDKTVEGIINRVVSAKPHEEWKQTIKMDAAETLKSHNSIVSLDDIEKKMNELHGIPFVERPAHELPKAHSDNNTEKADSIKSSNIPHHTFKYKLQKRDGKDSVTDNISDEEIIEHKPITGDMTINESKICAKSSREKKPVEKSMIYDEESNKEAIITEKDFDKFVRRNSITYENCLTVNFDGKESHNVIQTLVEKEVPCKKLTRNEMMLAESKAKSTNKHLMMRHNANHNKTSMFVKSTSEEDSFNKNYQSQSKVQLAYQSALTAKRQLECPVTIIEDKPVKVVFLDSGSDFTSSNLNVQGQELSPPKKNVLDSDSQSATESLDSDVVDTPYEFKLQEETKSKSKHQRKQVLTPVDIPELELIEPSDLGITESPKKKRKLEDSKEKQSKNIAPKKSYLLNRAIPDEKTVSESTAEVKIKAPGTETKSFVTHSDTISAIDNLVKAAELIETQSENKGNVINVQVSELGLNTPAKRGRGRPRKYPLSETSTHINKTPIIQKKPRVIDSNIPQKIVETDDSDSNEEFIKENWTMGKINENIVCPICNKLFRSENVVFKHVKHCTGPSPNRSDSDRRSLTKFSQSDNRSSSESDSSEDSEDDKNVEIKLRAKPVLPKKENEIIVIEDTLLKDKRDETKLRESNKIITKNKLFSKTDKLVCEFCGKTFRQLSYLVNHKQQHKKEEEKKIENNDLSLSKSIFSCEVCKKQFRMLHHLVQHRIIHNQNPMPSKLLRKNSNDKTDEKKKDDRDDKRIIRNQDQSAGFRCEPCDKSFRKLHHLVEHRETHDGINKKGSSINNAQSSGEVAKSSSQHICELCKRSFKKIQHLMEHKEQHLDSCSEKSDDKSSLSTKDIIHECSLCYMVFPNEHSLNKHTVICLRKKKQSAAKQAKLLELKEKGVEGMLEDDDKLSEDDNQNVSDKEYENEPIKEDIPNKSPVIEAVEIVVERNEISDDKTCENEIRSVVTKDENIQINCEKNEISHLKRNIKEEEKIEKFDDNAGKKQGKIRKIEVITILDTPIPKNKIANVKEKNLIGGQKRLKTNNVTQSVFKTEKSLPASSDDDEIRYMLNPNFKEKDTAEEKVFMKVRANKRSSLQFERPNSKELIKRRISLQNPPKMQRSKTKSTESKPVKIKSEKCLNVPVKIEHTDSDDSDVKYSFPDTVTQNDKKDKGKTAKRQSVVAKRKSITGIAKKKSLVKHKIPIPTQKVKRRTTEVEHRCDCGQLFSSAALLSRHTTLAHTPPRVRRPRDPPPDKPPKTSDPTIATSFEKRRTADQPKLNAPQQQKNKSVAPSNKPTVKVSRKSSAGSSASKSPSSKVVKSEPNVKTLRSSAHRGVPVPDKMRKFMERSK